mgnify:CR=1 FL=1
MTEPVEIKMPPPFEITNANGWVHGALTEGYVCEHCGGQGFVYEEDEHGFSMQVDCHCREWTLKLKMLSDAGIPGKFAQTRFETYHPLGDSQRLALRMAQDFVTDYGKDERGLLFMGKPGLGKTHLAVSILRALILERGVQCKFIDFFQLLSDIRFGYSQDLSEQAIINPYVHAPVLVIDELAKGRNTEWEQTMLDQIISSRYNAADRVTLFTTNFIDEPASTDSKKSGDGRVDFSKSYATQNTQAPLAERLGTRIYSRLTEMCRFVKLEGDDYRPHKVAFKG